MILIKNLTLRRGVKVVLQNASVTLNPNEKVGLVGRNGAGKSSLFSLFARRLQPDAGDVEMPGGIEDRGRVVVAGIAIDEDTLCRQSAGSG